MCIEYLLWIYLLSSPISRLHLLGVALMFVVLKREVNSQCVHKEWALP